MAMTKKELAEMTALKRAVLVAGAFVRTPSIKPDVMPPKPCREGPEYTSGFDYNLYDKSVYSVWSSSINHGKGPIPEEGKYRNASQNSIPFFSTRLRALQALRGAVERQAANDLADIDEEIQKEQEK